MFHRAGLPDGRLGLELLGPGAAAQDMWTAAVLLAAVTVDTTARRSRPGT